MPIFCKEDFELLLNFIMREKRYLKTRETSFSERQLKEGRKYLKDALAAAKKAFPKKGELDEALASQSKRARMAGAVFKKCKKFLSRRNSKLIVDNYAMFANVFSKPTSSKPAIELDPTKEDRFYAPRKHEYR